MNRQEQARIQYVLAHQGCAWCGKEPDKNISYFSHSTQFYYWFDALACKAEFVAAMNHTNPEKGSTNDAPNEASSAPTTAPTEG